MKQVKKTAQTLRKKAAAYFRSDARDNTTASITQQRRQVCGFAEKRGMVIIREFTDRKKTVIPAQKQSNTKKRK